jgi:integrase/recombinase XerD
MAKRKIVLSDEVSFRPYISINSASKTDMQMEEFLSFHEQFIRHKSLEGLASRTIEEHRVTMGYFKKYLLSDKRSIADCYANIDIFRGYLSYMMIEMQYKPCTVNIRLRTLKCYIRWLYDEKLIEEDYSKKLKLVKVPEDTIHPLSDTDLKKILKACDKNTYAGYRDFTLMILMIDCGIRVGEASMLKLDDVDLKTGIVNIRAENAKTRVFRQVPINKKTCKLLAELIRISESDRCEYIFQSTYGGQIQKQNIILSFARLGKKTGLKVRCTPHVFRHTFATNFVKAGGDIFTLQRILGHTTLAMCRKYIQLDCTDLIDKHNQVGMVDKYLR